jgi:uncharacterized phiE125 gp8 family phage protein
VTDSIYGLFGAPYPTHIRLPPNVRTIDVVTPPTIEPVTLAEAKAQSRVTDTAQDALIAAYIAAARQHVESITGLALVEQQWRVSFDRFEYPLNLPGGRVNGTLVVEYDDKNGDTQSIVEGGYKLDKIKGRLFPLPGASWPVTLCEPGAVRVTYTLGAPVDSGTVAIDPRAKAAILMLAAELFENREASIAASGVTTFAENPAVDRLLSGLTTVTV